MFSNELSHYGFVSLWNPGIIILTFIFLIIYLMLVGPLRIMFSESKPVSIRQKACFVSGLLIFYVALGSPLHLLGDKYLFSAHMLEQSLVYMTMPPLILLGTPSWLIRSLLNRKYIKKVFAALTYPLVSLLLFNGMFSFYHMPFIFDALVANTILHNLSHAVLTIASFLMWFPLVSSVPELSNLSNLKKLGYIFADGILLTPACALIIFADIPMYEAYRNAPQLFEILPPLDDQQFGGVVMKVVQEITYGAALGGIFFQWARQEKAKGAVSHNPSENYYKAN